MRVFIDSETKSDVITKHCYHLGAVKVMVRRKRADMPISEAAVEYNYNVNRREAIATFIAKYSNMPNTKQLIDIGMAALSEVRKRRGMPDA